MKVASQRTVAQNSSASAVVKSRPIKRREPTMTERSAKIVTMLDAAVARRNLLDHPFYRAWTAGDLSIERLRNYAVQYYPHVAAFPRYLSALHSRCDDTETRQAILENLIDEERGSENHPELWLRFAEALGVPRSDVLNAAPVPAASGLVEAFDRMAQTARLSTGLAALYVYESQTPKVAAAKIDGLRRFYGIDDARGLAFFRVHQEADVYHAQTVARLVERHCASADDERDALKGADAALGALWSLLDAV
jgi:pyrroloquinoline-quinone synthase